jgi:ribosomal protein L37AE/L43A
MSTKPEPVAPDPVNPWGKNPLADTIYVHSKQPRACTGCARKPEELKRMFAGLFECSHVECPLRRGPTAQPAQR